MSFVKDGRVALFPLKFIEEAIATYTIENGKSPKILVLAEDDYLDYVLSCTIAQAGQLNVKIMTGAWLKSGEIDLAADVKE